MNQDTGEIRTLQPGEKPGKNEILVDKLPDPNCLTCKGKGNVGRNPRTELFHACHCTLAGYKNRKIK